MSTAASRCFVIAHVGANHQGSPEMARQLIEAAADAGADAIAFEDIPPEAHTDLQRHAQSRALLFVATPLDAESADILEEIGVPLFKMGAALIGDLALLRHVASKKAPVVLSCAGASLSQIEAALGALEGCEVTLLEGAPQALAQPAQINLRAMMRLHSAFGVGVGYADRCAGPEMALAAVALGAAVLEKPLSMDRTAPGHGAALEPAEFSRLVSALRNVEAAMGDGLKRGA